MKTQTSPAIYFFLALFLSFAQLSNTCYAQATATEQDCFGARMICDLSSGSYTFVVPNGQFGEGAYPGEIPTGTCLGATAETNSLWFGFAPFLGGACFTITPADLTANYDWAVFNVDNFGCDGIFANAGAMQVECNASTNPGPTGANGNIGGLASPCLNFAINQLYVLVITNTSGSNAGYTLEVTPNTPPNIDDEEPTPQLPPNYSPDCGTTVIPLTMTEEVACSTVDLADFQFYDNTRGIFHTITNLAKPQCVTPREYSKLYNLTISPPLRYDTQYILTADGFDDLCGNTLIDWFVSFFSKTFKSYQYNTNPSACDNSTDGSIIIEILTFIGPAPYPMTWIDQWGDTIITKGYTGGPDTLSNLSSGMYYLYHNNCFIDSIMVPSNSNSSIYHDPIITNDNCDNGIGSIEPLITGTHPPFTFQWDDGPTAENRYNLISGSYILTVTDANACVQDFTYQINNLSNPTANAGIGGETCTGTFQLTAQPSISGSSGSWQHNGVGILFNPNSSSDTVLVSSAAQQTVRFIWTETINKCSNSDTIEVSFINQPMADAGFGGNVCGMNTQLHGIISPYQGTWSDSTGSLVTYSPDIHDPSAFVVVDNSLAGVPLTFYWSKDNLGCTDNDSVIFTFYDVPVAEAGDSGAVCDSCFQLNASPTNGTGTWSARYLNGTMAPVNFSPSDTTENALACSEVYDSLSFYWSVDFGVCITKDSTSVVFVETPLANAGMDDSICGDTYSLNASYSVSSAPNNGLWTSNNALVFSDTSDPKAVITVSTYGWHELFWREVNGACFDTDTLRLFFSEVPIANAGNDSAICELSYTLQASPSVGSGYWSDNSGGLITYSPNSLVPNPSVDAGSAGYGLYQFIWNERNNACSSSDTIAIRFVEQPSVYAGLNDSLCGDTYILQADTPTTGSGTWSILSGGTANFTNANKAITAVTINRTTENQLFFFVWTENNGFGCIDRDTVSILFKKQPFAFAGGDQDVCSFFFQLSANPSVSNSYWEDNSGGLVIYDPDKNSPNPNIDATAFGYGNIDFYWKEFNEECMDADTITITSHDLPSAEAGEGDTLCGNCVSLNADATAGLGTWSARRLGDNTPVSATYSPNESTENATACVLVADSIIFEWTTDLGVCISSDTTLVIFKPIPNTYAGEDDTICDLSYSLQALPSIGTGAWTASVSGTSYTPDSTDANAMVTVSSYDKITFSWTESLDGCTNSDLATISFFDTPVIEAGPDHTLCSDSVFLSGSSPGIGGSGTWTSSVSGVTYSPNTNDPNALAVVPSYGAAQFFWTIAYPACDLVDSLAVYFIEQPIANAGMDDSICGKVYGLNALYSVTSAPNSGTWSSSDPSDIFSTLNAPNATITISNYGMHTFTWTENNQGCIDAATVAIYFSQSPSANAGSDSIVCGQSFTLSATPSLGTGSWSDNSGGTIVYSSGNIIPNASVDAAAFGYGTVDFYWTENNNGCSASDTVSVNFVEQPIAYAGLDDSVCGGSITLNAKPAIGSGTWSILSGGIGTFGNTNSEVSSFNISVSSAVNSYTLVWTDDNGSSCLDEDTVLIKFIQQPIANAGTNDAICGLNYTLGARNSVGNGLWKADVAGVVFDNPASANAKATAPSYGAIIFTWTESNHFGYCIDSATTTVSFYEMPVANAGKDDSVCGLSTQINAAPSVGSGQWLVHPDIVFEDASDAKSELTANTYGSFTLIWKEENGACIDQDSVRITFSTFPAPDAGIDQSICDLHTSLDAQIDFSGGHWFSNPSGPIFSDSTDPKSDISLPASDSSYTIIWQENNGTCISNDTVLITSTSAPEVYAGKDDSICGNQYFLKAVSNGSSFNWSCSDAGVRFTDASKDSTTATVPNAGTYLFIAQAFNVACDSIDSLYITFFEQPLANAGQDDYSCTYYYTLSGNNLHNGYWVAYKDSGRVTFQDSLNPVCNIEVSQAGTYHFIWHQFKNFCTDADTVDITFFDPSPLYISPVDTIIYNDLGPFPFYTNHAAFNVWEWSFGDGDSAFSYNPTHTFNDYDSYLIGLNTIDSNGCPSQSSGILDLQMDVRVFIPNAFSPNNDGVNDSFAPEIFGIHENAEYQLNIYDRWGKQIFKSNQYAKKWDGKTNNDDQIENSGTFAYELQFMGIDGKNYRRNGRVTLLH
jgi:gliding motility-associated-like protein